MPSTPVAAANTHTLGGRAILIMEGADGKSHEIWTLTNVTATTHTLVGKAVFNEGADGAEYLARLKTVFGLPG
jgi:hypothetical protein